MRRTVFPLALALVAITAAAARALVATAPPPTVRAHDGITYVSGGVGVDGRKQIEQMAADHGLEGLKLVFSLDDGAYISDVQVTVSDSSGDVVLFAVSRGPLFYADLPPGRYRVGATAYGRTFEREVAVGEGQTVAHFRGWRSVEGRYSLR